MKEREITSSFVVVQTKSHKSVTGQFLTRSHQHRLNSLESTKVPQFTWETYGVHAIGCLFFCNIQNYYKHCQPCTICIDYNGRAHKAIARIKSDILLWLMYLIAFTFFYVFLFLAIFIYMKAIKLNDVMFFSHISSSSLTLYDIYKTMFFFKQLHRSIKWNHSSISLIYLAFYETLACHWHVKLRSVGLILICDDWGWKG